MDQAHILKYILHKINLKNCKNRFIDEILALILSEHWSLTQKKQQETKDH